MGKLIDAHTHIFPDKIAGKASVAIGNFYNNFHSMEADGTLTRLMELGKQAKVDHYVVFSAATRPEQVHSINDFIAVQMKANPGKVTGLGTLHPDMESPEEEIDRIISLGLKGIKLHPDFQEFYVDSPAAKRIYAYLEGKLPVLFHAGDYRYSYSSPRRIAQVSDEFPGLQIIAAHFGGWSEWRQAIEWIVPRKRICVDTCSALYSMSDEEAYKIIQMYGADRVLFGTDYPMWTYEEELEKLRRLPLTEKEQEMIFWKNAQEIFGICL